MTDRRRALVNTSAAGVQVICVGIVLVVLYRFLYVALGVEALGVWALVLASTAALSAAGLGLGTSVVKFVAQYTARDDHQEVSRIIRTATTSVAVVLALALVVCYPLLRWILGVIITPDVALEAALSILPYAVVAFWLITIGTVFQGSLDGIHRVDLRAVVIVVGQVVLLVLSWRWVPDEGLVGVAKAQVVQGLVYCIGGWILLNRTARFLPLLPFGWNWETFKRIVGYGANFQIISISSLLVDPVTKGLLATLGGIGLVGFYEMAYRLAFYLRSLIVTVHQALVPLLADMAERDPGRMPVIYRRSFHLIALFVATILPLLVALVPSISVIWLGESSSIFITYAAIILVAWFLNTLSNPAYFAFLGEGYLRWNVAGHVITAAINPVLGFVLGSLLGGIGVIMAFGVALLTGSLLVLWSYQARQHIPVKDIVQRQTLLTAFLGLGLLAVSLLIAPWLIENVGGLGAVLITLVGYFAILAGPLWRHPLRPDLVGFLVETRRKSGNPLV